jgi:predicted O-methyltransferase YrrM
VLHDNPLFHYADPEGVARAAAVGAILPVGDFSMAVSPGVLRHIAQLVRPDMVTIETGAGYTTVVLATLGQHHYCCTASSREVEKISAYLTSVGVPLDKITFVVGLTDRTLPELRLDPIVDFAYIDGCHGYPFPALDWHYIDRFLKLGGIVGMDNAELRPVREHCDFLLENGSYDLLDRLFDGALIVQFFRKVRNEDREWVDQKYSRAKRDPGDWRLPTRIRRKATKLIKPHLF